MTGNTYRLIENYMLSCMKDSAHDKEHIYRVLYNALEIAKEEENVDYDVLIGACLLHDIGREEEYENPALCHAVIGGEKAYRFLMEHGFEDTYAQKVKECIQSHRYRRNNPSPSIEAKILFDADKLDAAGAMGIARTLMYQGIVGEPLYSMRADGTVSNGENDTTPSFFQEYKHKLEKLYSKFYTSKGTELAARREHAAAEFYNCLLQEINVSYRNGAGELRKIIR